MRGRSPRALMRLPLAAMLAAALMLCSCEAKTPPPEAPAPTAELPVVTAELPGLTAAPLPSGGAAGNEDPSAADPERYKELNGIADAGDMLPIVPSYEAALGVNTDVIGWLTVPGTSIDYPVVRTVDNEFYLDHNIEQVPSKHGAVFMDFRNADASQQKHIVLYGHNMKNGTMFHDLLNFKRETFFAENRIVYFNWGGTETMWEIYVATVIPSNDNHRINYVETRFANSNAFAEYMADMTAYARTVSSARVYENTVISPSDQVLTLTTCTYETDGSRFAIQARRVK